MKTPQKTKICDEYTHVVVYSPDGNFQNLCMTVIGHLDELDDWTPPGKRLAIVDQYGHVSRPKEQQDCKLYEDLSWLRFTLEYVEFHPSFYITKQFELKYVWC